MFLAARKADLTGATRKYLATACPATSGPGFYTQADYGITTTVDATTGLTTFGVDATKTYPDPVSQVYSQWTTSPATTSPVYGFSAANVTKTNITNWAIGAGDLSSSTTPSAGLVASGSSYSNVGTNQIPNWVVARDFGPGTVGTAVPVSYLPSGATVVVRANVNLPYTYA
jgi:hypothetical protein